MSLPESFTSIQAKMNKNVKFAIDQMNSSLEAICADEKVSASSKFKVATEYLTLYMRLENEKMKEAEHKEILKNRKLSNKLKQVEVDEVSGVTSSDRNVSSNKGFFSPTMN